MSKIVFVHLKNDFSGSPVVLCSVIKALSGYSDDYRRLYVGSDSQGVLDDVDIDKSLFGYIWYNNKILRAFSYIVSQFRLIKELIKDPVLDKEAIIYVNTVLPVGAIIYGWLTGKRVVCHIHELPFGSSRAYLVLFKIAFSLASKIVFVSNYQRNCFKQLGTNIAVVPNCLKDMTYTKPPTPQSLSGQLNILFIGSFKAYKGVWEFAALAGSLATDSAFNFRMVLGGNDVEVEKFKCDTLRPKNLDIRGPSRSLENDYSWADVVVNFSLPGQWVETFGLTLLEAMSFSKPVIAPLIGGHTDFVEDGVNGFLIDASNQCSLISTLYLLRSDRDLYLALSHNAKTTASRHNYKCFSENIRQLVDNL